MPHPRPSWPRRLRRVCLFLVLGLGTTVGVAWGLAARFRVRGSEPGTSWMTQGSRNESSYNAGESWFSAVPYRALGSVRRVWSASLEPFADPAYKDHFQLYRLEFLDMQSVGPWAVGGTDSWGELPRARGRFEADERVITALDEAHGFPALALWGWAEVSVAPGNPLEFHGALELSDPKLSPSARRALPLLPIWPGLAFNTLFYALLWWLALASVRMINHNRRYRHGLCPLCRYDLRADYSQGCSECGWGR